MSLTLRSRRMRTTSSQQQVEDQPRPFYSSSSCSSVVMSYRKRAAAVPAARTTTPQQTKNTTRGIAALPPLLVLFLCCIFARAGNAFSPQPLLQQRSPPSRINIRSVLVTSSSSSARRTTRRPTAATVSRQQSPAAVLQRTMMILHNVPRPDAENESPAAALAKLKPATAAASSRPPPPPAGAQRTMMLHKKNVPRPADVEKESPAAASQLQRSTTELLLADQQLIDGVRGRGGGLFTSFSRILRQNDYIQNLEKRIDDISGGWALSYADLSPDSDQTIGGRIFLATNLAYGMAGAIITFVIGDYTLGLLTELCALASYNYHYYQLLAHGQEKADSVRLALLVDYVFAGASILTGTIYLWCTIPAVGVPTSAVVAAGVGVGFLLASWNWEYGRPYMVLHGIWHLCSATAGYLIADAYQQYSSSGVVVAAVAAAAAASTGTLT
jgi:hypothetical protein